MKDFTIISVFNNEQSFQGCLKQSVDSQIDISVETKYVDNSKNEYSNAKSALESAIDNCLGKYLIFSHQDIVFLNERELRTISNQLDAIGDFGIVGVAGVKGRDFISNIFHGKDKTPVCENRISQATECETVDECLFIIKNEPKYINRFKSMICDSWHMYAVEFCLLSRQQSEKVLVIPADVYHVSPGNSYDESYYVQVRKIARKYGKSFDRINCTMGYWHTNPIKLWNQIRNRRRKDIKNGTLNIKPK